MQIRVRPLITEKTSRLIKTNWYTFAAPVSKTKNQLEDLIKKTFNVSVLAIKTTVIKGKTRRSGKSRKTRRLSDWKKVMIKIKEGEKIDLFDQGA